MSQIFVPQRYQLTTTAHVHKIHLLIARAGGMDFVQGGPNTMNGAGQTEIPEFTL